MILTFDVNSQEAITVDNERENHEDDFHRLYTHYTQGEHNNHT